MKKIVFICVALSLVTFRTLCAGDSINKTIVITGGMTGIGYEIADAFADRGWNVWVTTRDAKKYKSTKKFRVLEVELTDVSSIQKAISRVYKDNRRIDVLVNNAGYGLLGPVEAISTDEIKKQLDVNVVATISMINTVLPIMRAQKSGHIINISSTSGVRAVPGLGAYAASKMALEGISEALATELIPWNINVSIVEPGTVNNHWAANTVTVESTAKTTLYKVFTTNLKNKLITIAKSGQRPKEIGLLVYKIANSSHPHLRYQTNEQANGVAKEIYNDPTGNSYREKMISFAKGLYQIDN